MQAECVHPQAHHVWQMLFHVVVALPARAANEVKRRQLTPLDWTDMCPADLPATVLHLSSCGSLSRSSVPAAAMMETEGRVNRCMLSGIEYENHPLLGVN